MRLQNIRTTLVDCKQENAVRRLSAALLFIVASASCALAQSLPVPSHWTNPRGSDLLLYTIDGSGAFTGAFINRAPGFACDNVPYDVHGQVHGHHVRFVVAWKNTFQDCKAHTAWSGRVSGNTLTTWWVETSVDGKGVARRTRGTDTFKKQF
jgi:hypothetical protein